MTLSQLQHHQEQMEAARREFQELKEKYGPWTVRGEIEFWKKFLKRKGLAK